MLYEYLKKNYQENEPILVADIQIQGLTKNNIRQQIMRLTNSGKLKLFPHIFLHSHRTLLVGMKFKFRLDFFIFRHNTSLKFKQIESCPRDLVFFPTNRALDHGDNDLSRPSNPDFI